MRSSPSALLPAMCCCVTASVACAVRADDQVALTGRVAEFGTARPLAGVPVGAVRWQQLRDQVRRGRVEPEKTALTDLDGRFRITVDEGTPGIDRVAVFTCAADRLNLVHPREAFDGRLPTLDHLRSPGVETVDLTGGDARVEFVLPSALSFLRDVMVPMRDGTRLATDIFFPFGRGPWPVLLFRTPYNKDGDLPWKMLIEGYAVVRQDFRGRFASEGESDMPFEPDGWGELQDGFDTIEWIGAQPWCNGKLGTVGASAGGITQVMTAGAAPPHLTCQSIAVACGSLYHHAVYQGGVFRKRLVEGWLANNRFGPECLEVMRAHPRYDDYWRRNDTHTRSKNITVPGLFIGGWYDVFCQGTIDAFMWRQYEGGPGAKGNQRLVMGPWVHGRSKKIGEFTLPDQSLDVPPEGHRDKWLAHWLQGEQNESATGVPVVYYVMGAFEEPGAPGHEWRRSDVWPVPSTPTPFYLHADGRLTRDPPAAGASRSFDYDPRNPVPTRGGCNLILDKGPYDQRPVEDRPDVLLYTSEPLTEPLEITGRIKACLWASSSCRDTDFTAKLTDVYPDGKSVLIQDGIIRARYRRSFEREELLEPGRPYPFEVDLWSTSLIFNRGHRIRVAVSSSNAPRFDPNPNTAAPPFSESEPVVARNTIYHDKEHPSHILLPVVGEGR